MFKILEKLLLIVSVIIVLSFESAGVSAEEFQMGNTLLQFMIVMT